MNRRTFIALLGGAVAAWPLAARAQQPAAPVIGVLQIGTAADSIYLPALLEGLRDAGYVEGRNVKIEFRWADFQYDRFPALVADLIGHNVAVIVAGGAVNAALTAKQATRTIPIVFVMG